MDKWLRLCALTAKGSIPVQGTKILQDVTKKKKAFFYKMGLNEPVILSVAGNML